MNLAKVQGSMSNGPIPVELLNVHQLQQQQFLAHQLLLRQQELQRQQLAVQQELDYYRFQWQRQVELQGTSSHGETECEKPRNPRNPRNPALRNAKGEVMDPVSWADQPTTLMVRRLPRHYTQRQLLDLVEFLGFEGLFDFLYLPWDIKYDMNARGFGFINFREPEYALMFREACKGYQVEGKTIQVHPAQLQGFEANYEHFTKSKIGQHATHRPIFIPRASNS